MKRCVVWSAFVVTQVSVFLGLCTLWFWYTRNSVDQLSHDEFFDKFLGKGIPCDPSIPFKESQEYQWIENFEVDKELQSNKTIISTVMWYKPELFVHSLEEYQNDEEFILDMFHVNTYVLGYIPEAIFNKKEFWLRFLEQDKKLVNCPSLSTGLFYALFSSMNCRCYYHYVPAIFKNDEDIIVYKTKCEWDDLSETEEDDGVIIVN